MEKPKRPLPTAARQLEDLSLRAEEPAARGERGQRTAARIGDGARPASTCGRAAIRPGGDAVTRHDRRAGPRTVARPTASDWDA